MKFSDRIVEFLQQPDYTPVDTPHLARAMGIGEAEYGEFSEAVDALHRVGRVVLGSDEALMLPRPASQVYGTFRANPRGFGFVIPEDAGAHGDLYVGEGDALDAVTGDKVLCKITGRGHGKKRHLRRACILRVLERAHSRFVGQLTHEGKTWYVIPDGNILHAPILIADPGVKGARDGDQVVVEIIRYPSARKSARGVIIERLGKPGEPGVDLRSVINTHHLPHEFTEELLAEVRATAQSFDPQAESVHRETLAGQPVITIDPESARDYDDAISLRRVLDEPNGTDWELGVHIADVSHFVPRDSLVDEEAFERGTSVYFPGHVIPMLPELLSNGLCSLQEGEQRLCKSVFIRYDRHGRVVARRYASTVICSDCRLSYQQATAIIEDQAVDVPDRVYKLVRDMADLARIIRERRLADGMIVLDLPAVDLVLDKQGEVVDAQPEDTSFSHTVIEMFMVEANEAVADLFDRFKVPYLRRIHPPPGAEDRESMRQYFRALGIPVRGKIKPRDIQQGLAEVEDKPGAFAANLFVLKSLQTAEYSPRKTGHFALASQAYAHFTSPIRRYPDLMIHRLLERLLPQLPAWIPAASGKPTHRDADAPVRDMPSGRQLEEIGQTLSCKARRAEAAEQELKTLKVLRLLQRHVGETFTGVATGITQFGIFVQHPRYLVDGLVRLERLGDDWWEVKADKGQVVGVRSGRVWSLGSEMEVVIDQVDLPARQMALSMAGKQRGSRRKQSGKPKKHSRKAGRGRASGKPNRSRRKR